MPSRSILTPRWGAGLAVVLVIGLFCVPLFLGLGEWDQRNDEAIYSYAVDRILETGHWMTPRSIFTDLRFIEKPPLKFWIIAASMKLGLIPFNDWGMRFYDALFAAMAYLYIFAIGRRLAGTIAGVVSVFLAFSFDPLAYWHGIRGNNMEAAMILAYCGGMYHFLQWADTSGRAAKRHALAFSLYFVLAFMTKFVAALFLPFVCVLGSCLRPGAWAWGKARIREWIGPTVVAIVLIVPWFVYELFRYGKEFVDTILMEHIVKRFAGTLIPDHIHPWYYYFRQTWLELGYSGMTLITVFGFVALVYQAWRKRDWTAQVLLIWWFVPLVMLSLGTSKLFYYAHPFFPPLAIGGALACVQLVELIGGDPGRGLIVRLGLKGLAREREASRRSTTLGQTLAVIGGLAFVMAVWTAFAGVVRFEIGGVRIFSSASVPRAILIGTILWHLAGFGSIVLRLFGVAVIALFLPLSGFGYRYMRGLEVDHPLRTARDCALEVMASGAKTGSGIFNASGDTHHGYYYYFRRLGPWLDAPQARPDELERRLESPGEQTLTVISAEDYVRLGGVMSPVVHGATGGSWVKTPGSIHLANGIPPGIAIGDVVVILFPGPFSGCVDPVVKANAKELKAQPPR